MFGTTSYGGQYGNGTIFKIDIGGSSFTTLYNFSGAGDGANPLTGLIRLGTTLYGTAANGGSFGNGTIFSINMDGTGFTNLYQFSGSFDGANPLGGLLGSANVLYGTTANGGDSYQGTVFSFLLANGLPLLSITKAGENVVLTWTNTAAGYSLQSTHSLVPPVTWAPVSPAPLVVNGQNTVTNFISGTQRFYRLSQ